MKPTRILSPAGMASTRQRQLRWMFLYTFFAGVLAIASAMIGSPAVAYTHSGNGLLPLDHFQRLSLNAFAKDFRSALQKESYDKAIAVVERAILSADDSLGPCPFLLAAEARTAVKKKDYDKAIGLLENAIAANPGDVGANFDPWLFGVQGTESVRHGKQQLANMLRDRPFMGTHLDSSDELSIWTAFKYGERILGSRIDWDATDLEATHDAEHEVPWMGYPGRIRVRNLLIDPKLSDAEAKAERLMVFEKEWQGAAFELHNIESAEVFQHVYDQALKGEIGRDKFVKAMFFVELNAIQRTRKWYVEVFLPHAKKYDLPTDPGIWFCSMWGPPESIFRLYTDKNSYPWEPYSTYYSQLKSQSKTKNASAAKTKP